MEVATKIKPEVGVTSPSQIEVGERFRKDYGNIDRLVNSILSVGIIQPLAVKRLGEDTYRLLAGGRRFQAVTKAKVEIVPIRIYDKELGELEMRSIELMENVERKDLEWQEEVALTEEIHNLQMTIHGGAKKSTSADATGWSVRDTSDLLMRSAGTISQDLKLARIAKSVPEFSKAKTKSEALKLLRKGEEEILLAELASRVAAKEAASGEDLIMKTLRDSYLCTDVITGIEGLPDKSIELAEIDPPYGVEFGRISGDERYKETEDLAELLSKTLRYLHFKMSNDSWIIVWFPTTQYYPVFNLITEAGFSPNPIPGIWVKPGAGRVQRPEEQLGNNYETFFYASKGKPRLNQMGHSNVYTFRPIQGTRHPVERPIEFGEALLATFAPPGSTILVPFAGSGNMLLSAYNIGMPAIGIDNGQTYKDSFDVHVSSAGRPFKSYRKED